MSDSLSKDFKDAIDDVAVSLHKGFKKVKENKQVKDFTKSTVGAFENLGEQLEKDFKDIAGKAKTEVKKEEPKEEKAKEPVKSDENPIKEEN